MADQQTRATWREQLREQLQSFSRGDLEELRRIVGELLFKKNEAWWEMRRQVLQRDRYTCQYCGARGVPLDVDHKLPMSRGGLDKMENLVTACKLCNASKGKLTPEEWQNSRRPGARRARIQQLKLADLKAGMYVHHPRFQSGIVESVVWLWNGRDVEVTVDFALCGRKRLMGGFAALDVYGERP